MNVKWFNSSRILNNRIMKSRPVPGSNLLHTIYGARSRRSQSSIAIVAIAKKAKASQTSLSPLADKRGYEKTRPFSLFNSINNAEGAYHGKNHSPSSAQQFSLSSSSPRSRPRPSTLQVEVNIFDPTKIIAIIRIPRRGTNISGFSYVKRCTHRTW
ncbi:MAG: hypothetical protein MZU97_09830 [Bacillus subtilis]|nr:hypothetical protein [Bacillus subtilis]